MEGNDNSTSGLIQSISNNLGAVFRHLFPGILIIGAAEVAHPSWFSGVDTRSWQHILIGAVVALALGNTWFAVNRYGVHQAIEYVMYLLRWKGPSKKGTRFTFHSDLGEYVASSLCSEKIPSRARHHVAFRASSVLLLYTVAEIGFFVAFSHESNTLIWRHPYLVPMVSFLILLVAIWQDAITRRIDDCLVDRGG